MRDRIADDDRCIVNRVSELRAAEASAQGAEADARRLDWLDIQADDWTYKDRKAWHLVGAKHLSLREAIDELRPTAALAPEPEGKDG